MSRHGVRAERIKQKQVKSRVGLPRKLKPAVTNHHIAVGSASRYEREEATRNRLDRGIDLVKPDVMRSIRVRRHGPGAESQNAETLRLLTSPHHLDNIAHGSARIVVRQGLTGARPVRA